MINGPPVSAGSGSILRGRIRPAARSTVGTRVRGPRTATVSRDLGMAGQPEPPRPVRRHAHPHPWAAEFANSRIAEPKPDRRVRGKKVNSVVLHAYSERRAEIAWAPRERRGPDARPAAQTCHVRPSFHHGSPQQHGGGRPVRSAAHIGAHVDSVAAVGVKPSRWPEHDGVSRSRSAVGVGGGIRPGSVGRTPIGLDFNDPRGRRATEDDRAQQSACRCDRVPGEQLEARRRRCQACPAVSRSCSSGLTSTASSASSTGIPSSMR